MSAGRRRLWRSFALALGVGVAYIALLHALISVRRPVLVQARIVGNVGFGPILIVCHASPELRPRPSLAKAHLPPPMPPIEIPHVDVAFPAELEVLEFDPSEIVTLS